MLKLLVGKHKRKYKPEYLIIVKIFEIVIIGIICLFI